MSWSVQTLRADHDRTGFDCGQRLLNDYLKKYARQNQDAGVARTYVLVEDDKPQVVGYHSLAGGQVLRDELPAAVAKRLPRYPVPVVLLARLAVDQRYHGKGLGGFLLRDALTRSLAGAEVLGLTAIVVDALDATAAAFYQRFGFAPLASSPLRLFLPMATLRAARP